MMWTERHERTRKLVIVALWAVVVGTGLVVAAVAALIHWVCC